MQNLNLQDRKCERLSKVYVYGKRCKAINVFDKSLAVANSEGLMILYIFTQLKWNGIILNMCT